MLTSLIAAMMTIMLTMLTILVANCCADADHLDDADHVDSADNRSSRAGLGARSQRDCTCLFLLPLRSSPLGNTMDRFDSEASWGQLQK